MKAKQDWTVTIVLNETEGDSTSTQPWYKPQDIVELIRGALHRNGPMRDLNVQTILARANGARYYQAEKPA